MSTLDMTFIGSLNKGKDYVTVPPVSSVYTGKF
jgi:hypothetical protein